MRRILTLTATAAALAACAIDLEGYSGGASGNTSSDGGPDAAVEGGVISGSDGGSPNAPNDPPMLVTATNAKGTRIRRWDAATAAWGPPTDGPAAPSADPIRGITVRRSPVNGHRAMAMYTISADAKRGSFYLFDWDGSKFVQVFANTDFGAFPGWAPFDLAFDGKTGHGFVVYGGATDGNLRLRVFDGTKWGDEKTAFATPPNDEPYQFVQLVTRPGTDDLAMLWTDQGSNFDAAMWTGNGFGAVNGLNSQTPNDIQPTFGGAFESTRGDLLIAWAASGSVFYSVTRAGAPTIANKGGDLMFAPTGRIVVAADPASDQIAMVTLEQNCGMKACDDFTGIMWTGTAWDLNADGTLDSDITSPYGDLEGDAPSTVAWSGKDAVAMYHRDSPGFRWGRWSGGAWKTQTDYAPQTTIGPKASFVPFHVDGRLYTLVEDRDGTLWNVAYVDGAWRDDDGNQAIADDLPSPTDFNGITFSTDTP